MADYGVYIWSSVGITVGCLGWYLSYIFYKTKQANKL
jgi:heme exporter protein CcmD